MIWTVSRTNHAGGPYVLRDEDGRRIGSIEDFQLALLAAAAPTLLEIVLNLLGAVELRGDVSQETSLILMDAHAVFSVLQGPPQGATE